MIECLLSPAHEILVAKERTAEEWRFLRDGEPVGSFAWATLNGLFHLRRSLDRGDLAAARVWAYMVRQCQAAEARAMLLGGERECLMR